MSFSLSELTTALTVAEVKASIYAVIEAQGTDTSSWKPGAVTRAMITGVAIVLAAMSTLIALTAEGGFISKASADWLTLRAKEERDVTRQAATFAAGNVTFVNAGGGIYVLAIGDVIVSNPTTGKEYTNTTAFTIGVGATETRPVQATEAGAASSSTIGAISNMVTTLTDVTVSNAASIVGLDEETDTALRVRCASKLGNLSNSGPSGAYDYAAKAAVRAADSTSVGVTRTRSIAGGFGNLTTYCATASGAVPGAANDPSTDLGAVDVSINALAETLGIVHTTSSATALPVNITYALWCWSDIDVTERTELTTELKIAGKIQEDLTAYLAAIQIGGQTADLSDKIFVDAVQTVIGAAFPEIYRVDLTAPAADTAIAINEAPAIGTIGASVNLVQRQS